MTDKERALRDTLSSLGSVVVAYSGGVDSAYLACVAHDTLGDRAPSPSPPTVRAIRSAIARWPCEIAGQFGLRHEIIHTSELERPEYRANPANRCYYCKHELYTHLVAHRRGARRGRRRRQQRRRPRRLSAGPPGRARVRRAQSARRSRISARTRSASCRGAPDCRPGTSRRPPACRRAFPYHSEVTDEKLRMIERAEEVLRGLGFRVCRVRHHDDLARVELGRDGAGARARARDERDASSAS